jgi:hypothetical protein
VPAAVKAIVSGKTLMRAVRTLERRDGMAIYLDDMNESYDIRSICQLHRERGGVWGFSTLSILVGD